MRYLNLASYFGGKHPQLNWLLQHFPKGNYHFIDLCCGMANVALNVDYPIITINDLNEDAINLFEVLRTREEEFYREIYFTPFSRKVLEQILTESPSDPVVKARNYFARCQLGFGANGSQNNHNGCGSAYYRVDNWNNKMQILPQIAEKLRSMQIEKKDMFGLLEKVNRPNNIIYIDPPYVLSTRLSKKRYKHEWEDDEHALLAEKVANSPAMIAISGYATGLYEELFPKSDWIMTKGPNTKSTVSKKAAQECLWTNYDPMIPIQAQFSFS